MTKSREVKPKKGGRPATGSDPADGTMRLAGVRAYVVRGPQMRRIIRLSEAIRRLVEIGLKAKGK